MSGEKSGKNFLLKVDVGGGTYETLGGLQSKSYSLSADGIDVTNHESNQDQTFLDQAGVLSMSVSGSGVHNGNANLNTVEDACLNQSLTSFQLIDDSGRTYTADMKVTSFERTGDHSGAQTYSVSLDSSGGVTVS